MDNVELGKRIRAARGYAGVSQEQLGEALGFAGPRMNRLENAGRKTQLSPAEREGIIKTAARVTGLPAEFFTVDFSSLPEMAAAWEQVRREGATAEDLIPAQEKDEGETLPADPNGSRSEERGP
ncbi:MAG TPA: helix-turn-helix transcriptional regulator [Solirubrobacterales bacterium]|nr:helix-turn-helix transcriptional regulator [Solirubrobacterales bacterium]